MYNLFKENLLQRPSLENIRLENVIICSIILNFDLLKNLEFTLHAKFFSDKINERIIQYLNDNIDKDAITPSMIINHFQQGQEDLDIKHHMDTIFENISIGGSTFYSTVEKLKELYVKRRCIEIGLFMQEKALDFESTEHLNNDQLFEQTNAMIEQLYNEVPNQSNKDIKKLNQSLTSCISMLQKAYISTLPYTGVDTGFRDLNNMLQGFQSSDLIILAARPSMGKTTLALNMATCAAKYIKENPTEGEKPGSVTFYSLEMPVEQVSKRAIKSYIGVDDYELGKIINDGSLMLSKKFQELHNLPLYIDDSAGLTIEKLQTKLRRNKKRYNTKIAFIDYVQLLRAQIKENKKYLEITKITNLLKALAKELEIPIVALSQLSRASETRENNIPQLSDLRDSGSIEQDADIVLFLYREEVYLKKTAHYLKNLEDKTPRQEKELSDALVALERVRNKAQILIAKHRNGPIGEVELNFRGEHFLFTDNH